MGMLPARPLAVRKSFATKKIIGAIFLTLFAVAAIAGGGWLSSSEARAIRHDARVWALETNAVGGSVKGKEETNNFLLHSYDVKVKYTDQSGLSHEVKLSFHTVGISVDTKRDLEIRYDPANPDDCVLSWSMNVTSGRWIYVAFMGSALALLGLGFLAMAFGGLRQLGAARRCAVGSEEVELEVQSFAAVMKGRKPTGRHLLRCLVAAPVVGGKGKVRVVRYARGRFPLFADGARRKVIALVASDAPDRPVLVGDDFSPFLLTPDQERVAREEIARRQNAAPAAAQG